MPDGGALPKSLPPTKPGTTSDSKTYTVTSEQECSDLFLREVSALPEREPATSNTTSPTDTQMPIMPRRDSAQTDSVTRNNVWIGRTVRIAMSNVLSGS
ncbi:Hypothetical protein NCS54_00734400 [Fusarium falciforme]|uniref:Hypothetical protein n=1 Tax=Fusarium falciforme TaxID=195108 RepID=UPI002301CE25|nr:Hypothetical protein NCS54_00734400 [Fusarium falciforme]WAO89940.1 Hypothetical protein NCS54_00734400 [Fusarium falciforme]